MAISRGWVSLLILGAWPLAVEAQRPAPQEVVLIYKDGFSIRGKVNEKTNVIFDSATGRAYPVFTGNFFLDDHVRNILFSRDQVQCVTKVERSTSMFVQRLTRVSTANVIRPYWEFEGFTDWNEKGERTALFGKPVPSLVQKVAYLTPQHILVVTDGYNWKLAYFTQEFGPELTGTILKQTYDQMRELKAKNGAQKLLEMAKFMQEAGWYTEAEKRLEACILDYPSERKAAQAALDELKKIRATLLVESIKQAAKVGQHQIAMDRMAIHDRDEARKLIPEEARFAVQDLKAKYDKAKADIVQAKAYLKDLPGLTKSAALWKKASEFIALELNYDTIGRLQKFLDFAEQHANDRKAKRKASQSAEEVLAMAVSGWLQGNQAAEPDVSMAVKLARARDLILQYLKTGELQNRAELAASFKSDINLDTHVIARLIGLIPPAQAEDPKKLGPEPQTMKIAVPGGVIGSYQLQLPPGYHHGRSYPVLMVLSGMRGSSDDTLKQFSAEAAKHGFILAAPLLAGQGDKKWKYGYSAGEHALAIDTLRDLRRRFQIDSDRVFMFGWEEGATMALDVGLGHPDLFAGVVSMNGFLPDFTKRFYWPNAQYLPLYIIEGERNTASAKAFRELFLSEWKSDPFMATYVEYKGRSIEWYGAEVPFMMNWMSVKKRQHPLKEVGHYRAVGGTREFHSSRVFDNRFYWLSSESIEERSLHNPGSPTKWRDFFKPGAFQAQLTIGNQVNNKTKEAKIWNQLDLRVYGLNQVSVWLTPGVMDFANDVKIRVNTTETGGMRKIRPSLEFMLEEMYQSGDRQRVFVGKIDIRRVGENRWAIQMNPFLVAAPAP